MKGPEIEKQVVEQPTDLHLLRKFEPFRYFPAWQLIPLITVAERQTLPPMVEVCRLGDNEPLEYFLVSGTVELTANDGRQMAIQSGTSGAEKPLARLRPRQYTVTTETPVELLVFHQPQLRNYLYEVSPSEQETILQESDDLYNHFLQDLKHHRIPLPTQPELAPQLQALLYDPVTPSALAKTLVKDPAITAKILRIANSPLFMDKPSCFTLTSAITRLGISATAQLAQAFSASELFHSHSPALVAMAQRIINESREVAAICCVLARHCSGYDMEQALLTGLLHNLGTLLVEYYLELQSDYEEIAQDQQQRYELARKIGQELLKEWHFAIEFTDAAAHIYDWDYESTEVDDYTTLLIAAQALHQLMHAADEGGYPHLEIKALNQLPLGPITPELSIQLINEAKQQLTYMGVAAA